MNLSSPVCVCDHVYQERLKNKQLTRVSERRIVGRVPNTYYEQEDSRSTGQNEQKTRTCKRT